MQRNQGNGKSQNMKNKKLKKKGLCHFCKMADHEKECLIQSLGGKENNE